jgi:DNA-directed RNA polymerase subunit alpha
MIEPIFHTKIEDQTDQYAKFIFEPLHLSFGNSIGNAIRRTLLSSLPGYAISHVKIEGATQLFATLPGVKESVLDIVLNLKKLRFTGTGEGPFSVHMKVKGGQNVTASNFEGEAEIVTGDVYIAEITDDKATLEIEAIVEKGYGFVASEEKESKAGYITLDSSFRQYSASTTRLKKLV